MRLVYQDASTSCSVTEYMVVRASLREEGLGYILTFSHDPVVGDEEYGQMMAGIFESFTLLGAVDGGRKPDLHRRVCRAIGPSISRCAELPT